MGDHDQTPPEGLSRRQFVMTTACAVTGAVLGASPQPAEARSCSEIDTSDDDTYEYVVIGTGAGGGPVAANLAKAGHRVLVLEAGGDGQNPASRASYSGAGAAPTLDPALGWAYWVNRPTKEPAAPHNFYVPGKGTYYPRGSTIGGSTAVNSLIALYPANEDWEQLAALTGDPSWAPDAMRGYFQRLEAARYLEPHHDPEARHGWDGWLPLELTGTKDNLLRHPQMARFVAQGIEAEPNGAAFARAIAEQRDFRLDANDWRQVTAGAEGVVDVPRAALAGERRGTRELLLSIARSSADFLQIRTNCLATRLLFDDVDRTRVVGVEYLEGPHLYAASLRADEFTSSSGTLRRVRATREVILAAGAFNSPQLLQLSGVGPAELLRAHGIPVVVDLPGVGRNLQDRLETGVVFKVPFDPNVFAGCSRGAAEDPCRDEFYKGSLTGTYRTRVNKQAFVLRRSRPDLKSPDLVLFGISNHFRGYVHPSDAAHAHRSENEFTWTVLKGRTRNTAGVVAIRSADARQTPDIQFNNWGEQADKEDLEGLLAGVRAAQEFGRRGMGGAAPAEVSPGLADATDDALRAFLRREVWGHHASCSNKMGPRSDPMAVVDGDFRVHGVKGLRVVDASVFPKIPGLFIVVPIYMIAEKASDAILADAARSRQSTRRTR